MLGLNSRKLYFTKKKIDVLLHDDVRAGPCDEEMLEYEGAAIGGRENQLDGRR